MAGNRATRAAVRVGSRRSDVAEYLASEIGATRSLAPTRAVVRDGGSGMREQAQRRAKVAATPRNS